MNPGYRGVLVLSQDSEAADEEAPEEGSAEDGEEVAHVCGHNSQHAADSGQEQSVEDGKGGRLTGGS